jgi:hypothetical protein
MDNDKGGRKTRKHTYEEGITWAIEEIYEKYWFDAIADEAIE